MKRGLCLILMCVLLSGPVVFACGDAPSTPVDISLLFAPTAEPVGSCGSYCPDKPTGTVDWTGDKVSIINLDTGDGFCTPVSTKILWSLCDCDNADKIKIDGTYGFTIEITTPGARFETSAAIETPELIMSEYDSRVAMCAEATPVTHALNYHIDNSGELDYDDVVITESRKTLFTVGRLYLSFSRLPRIIIDERIVPYGTPITLKLGLYDASLVCAPDCSKICECTTVVAYMGCINECCAVTPYLPLEYGWWSGIAITNLTTHSGGVVIVFVTDEKKVVKHFDVGALGILTISVGDYADKNCLAAIKSSFNMRVVSFGGTENMAFALPASSCSGCQ